MAFTITKDTLIGDILEYDESTSTFFLEMGMHCLGCPSARGESIEQACMVHGVDPNELIEKINAHIQQYCALMEKQKGTLNKVSLFIHNKAFLRNNKQKSTDDYRFAKMNAPTGRIQKYCSNQQNNIKNLMCTVFKYSRTNSKSPIPIISPNVFIGKSVISLAPIAKAN